MESGDLGSLLNLLGESVGVPQGQQPTDTGPKLRKQLRSQRNPSHLSALGSVNDEDIALNVRRLSSNGFPHRKPV